jgi:catechol 2,3-dioxygenase-like lactoylglutathione lyase family enzyme
MPFDVHGLCPLLQVYDMPTSVKFYRDILGFELVSASPNLGAEHKFHWCLLRLGGGEVMLNTAYEFDNERPVPADPARVAAHHDTCIYFGAPDVDAVYEELRAKGLQLNPPKVAPYGMRQLYLHDPDGYGLCFQWSADRTDSATNQ